MDIEQLCIADLGCPQPLALLVPSEFGQAKTKEALNESLTSTLDAVNVELPNYQKISTIVIVKEAWSVENGLLTPTLKVKRNEMNKYYQANFLTWHESKDKIVWE